MLLYLMEKAYRSPLGRLMSWVAGKLAMLKKPRMIYGYVDPASGCFRKYTRISDTAVIMNPSKLSVDDHVWIWHYSIIDATEGITIEEGCQIGAWVGIFTHGSQISIRLYGRDFVHIPAKDRIGYTRGSVKIGKYTFIGAGAVVLPGASIGKGCLIASGTIVPANSTIPDCSIVAGSPGKVVGSTTKLDRKFLMDGQFNECYFDKDVLKHIMENASSER